MISAESCAKVTLVDLLQFIRFCKRYTRINPNNLFYFDNNGKVLEVIPLN